MLSRLPITAHSPPIRSPLNSASGVPCSAQCSGFARSASAHSLRQRDHFSHTRTTTVRTHMLLALRCSHHSAACSPCSSPFAASILRTYRLIARRKNTARAPRSPRSFPLSLSSGQCCARMLHAACRALLLSLRCSHHSATPAVHSPPFALALLSLPGSLRDGKPPLERADHCAFALLPSVSIGALPACGLLRTAALAALLASLRCLLTLLLSLCCLHSAHLQAHCEAEKHRCCASNAYTSSTLADMVLMHALPKQQQSAISCGISHLLPPLARSTAAVLPVGLGYYLSAFYCRALVSHGIRNTHLLMRQA